LILIRAIAVLATLDSNDEEKELLKGALLLLEQFIPHADAVRLAQIRKNSSTALDNKEFVEIMTKYSSKWRIRA
jgi:hypothetical protein